MSVAHELFCLILSVIIKSNGYFGHKNYSSAFIFELISAFAFSNSIFAGITFLL